MSVASSVPEPPVVGPLPACRWSLRRNCALTPRQVTAALGLAAGLATAVGLAWWALGYPMVAAFTALEVAALAGALVFHARHARDGEWIQLEPACLRVEQRCGPELQVTTLPAAWVRVTSPRAPQALLGLSAAGRSVQVGRHVPAPLRARLAAELRSALHAAHSPR